jgi:hypothetical protein
MGLKILRDNGGRRSLYDRRIYLHLGPVLEKRWGRDRRSGLDRRSEQHLNIRPLYERRKSFGEA